jgi:hypothetical protein
MALILAICSTKSRSGIVCAQDSKKMVIKIENDNSQYVRYFFFMSYSLSRDYFQVNIETLEIFPAFI